MLSRAAAEGHRSALPESYFMIGNLKTCLFVLALVTAIPSAAPAITDAISPEEYAVYSSLLNSRLIGSGTKLATIADRTDRAKITMFLSLRNLKGIFPLKAQKPIPSKVDSTSKSNMCCSPRMK